MSTVLVSVILPAYNAEAHVSEALDSILHQTIKDWELIVVDDGSTDGTSEKVRLQTDPRIKLVRLTENKGYPYALNVGIAESTGKYIARMDADDVCDPHRLEFQLEALHLYPQASMCGVNQFKITPGGKMFGNRALPEAKYVLETWENLMNNHRLFTDPSVLLEKEKVIAVGAYRTFQRSGMDVDLWLRVMEKFGPCVTITRQLYGKRLQPGSIIFNPDTYLRNQIPRALAKQRHQTGPDEVQRGIPVDLSSYLDRGLIAQGNRQEKLNMLYGAFIACLWVRDWKGAKSFWAEIKKNDFKLSTHWGTIFQKVLKKIEKNPFRRISF